MDVAFKILNSIRTKAFQQHLLTQEFERKQLILHLDVRWLSSGKFLQRFCDLLEEIRAFLLNRGDSYAKLNNFDWLSELAFHADFTGRLASLNLQLQGKDVNSCIDLQGKKTVQSFPKH